MKGQNLYVLYYNEKKKPGKQVSMECLVEVEPEQQDRSQKPSSLSRLIDRAVEKIVGLG